MIEEISGQSRSAMPVLLHPEPMKEGWRALARRKGDQPL